MRIYRQDAKVMDASAEVDSYIPGQLQAYDYQHAMSPAGAGGSQMTENNEAMKVPGQSNIVNIDEAALEKRIVAAAVRRRDFRVCERVARASRIFCSDALRGERYRAGIGVITNSEIPANQEIGVPGGCTRERADSTCQAIVDGSIIDHSNDTFNSPRSRPF